MRSALSLRDQEEEEEDTDSFGVLLSLAVISLRSWPCCALYRNVSVLKCDFYFLFFPLKNNNNNNKAVTPRPEWSGVRVNVRGGHACSLARDFPRKSARLLSAAPGGPRLLPALLPQLCCLRNSCYRAAVTLDVSTACGNL